MVKLRLARFGGKKNAFYRIVATDSRNGRDSRWLEQLGTYDPHKPVHAVTLDLARVDYWMSVGAQTTGTVGKIVERARQSAVA